MTNQLLAELEMANIKIKELQQELTDYKERNENAIEYINSHTILVYTKEAPRQLVGTKELKEILDKKEGK